MKSREKKNLLSSCEQINPRRRNFFSFLADNNRKLIKKVVETFSFTVEDIFSFPFNILNRIGYTRKTTRYLPQYLLHCVPSVDIDPSAFNNKNSPTAEHKESFHDEKFNEIQNQKQSGEGKSKFKFSCIL